MEKKSGVEETGRSLPSGGGGIRSIGDTFQPNLAMGGGAYRVPLDLPAGPGGFAPKLDLLYNTGFGLGPFGLGWLISALFIERKRRSPYLPPGTEEYTLTGAETLVPLGGDAFAPFIQQTGQIYHFDGESWSTTTAELVEMHFGASPESRQAGLVDGTMRTGRWFLERVVFPGGREVHYEYEQNQGYLYLSSVKWSVFHLDFVYEDRTDPFSSFASGFETRVTRRCQRIELHQNRLAPDTLTRSYTLGYTAAGHTGAALLSSIQVSGWRRIGGAIQEARLTPLTFGYTTFDPAEQSIQAFGASPYSPPPLGNDVTLLDYRGTALPGILCLDGERSTYWENRGGLRWGPPQPLLAAPQGVHLGESRVQFADMTGNGTADLVVADTGGGLYYPNDPEKGLLPPRSLPLAPGFALDEEGTYLLDLDGDGIVDLLTFRNGTPVAFFNQQGESWSAPVPLSAADLPDFTRWHSRLRFADMNGDGLHDLVFLASRLITYWPYMGNGLWGAPRTMANTPDFDASRPDAGVFLTDLDDDGAADLVLIGNGAILIYLNQAGEGFSAPIELERTPRLKADQLLLTDMTGSGTAGFLWTTQEGYGYHYWYLDPLNGVKPYLLNHIDNGQGLVNTIEYTTSTFERANDLEEGLRWSGYLPFSVHVVKRMVQQDTLSGQRAVTTYRYHEGHFDGVAREYLGFGQVDAFQDATEHEDALQQRFYFHNRGATARDPAFIAGKGQPHRTELWDPATGELRQVEEAQWEARLLPEAREEHPAYLAVETLRASQRFESAAVYESERIEFAFDALGNKTSEHRYGEWRDSQGNPRTDELVILTDYATHAIHGLTSFPGRIRHLDGNGHLLRLNRHYYDGAPFVGLPLFQVERGWKSRETEVALTSREVSDVYGALPAGFLDNLYWRETDADYGDLYMRDTHRYRHDNFGNQIETLDALNNHSSIVYDAEGIHPVSISEFGEPARTMEFDPIAQQLARIVDANGHLTEARYDGLGNIVEVYRRGALPGLPSESYEYQFDRVPHVIIQRLRVRHDDAEPGYVQYRYQDGSGRVCQVKTLRPDGRWAVEKQKLLSLGARTLGERAAYYATSSAFESTPPPGVPLRHIRYDFASRVREEQTYDGHMTRYRYVGSEARYYGVDDSAAILTNPASPPTRVSRTNAWGKIVSFTEQDSPAPYEERREYDALGRLVRIINPLGAIALANTYDLQNNPIRIVSAEKGTTISAFNALNRETLRLDARNTTMYWHLDSLGRIVETRSGGIGGAVEESFSYDTGDGNNLKRRLAQVIGAFGAVNYSYSPEGDITRIRRSFAGNPTTYELLFTYDAQRNVTQVRYPDGTQIAYNYGTTGLLADIPGFINTVSYTPAGEREQIVFPNGLETVRHYTPGDDLLQELHTRRISDNTAYQHLVYTLDGVGQVTRIDDLSSVIGKIRNNQTFTYDKRNRLIHATGRGADGPYDYTYRYDPLGNPVFSGEAFAEDMDYGHHLGDLIHPNRLIKRHSANSDEYHYDVAGNLIADPTLGTLTYDARSRLVQVERPGGINVQYVYDHLDQRTATHVTTGGVTTTRYEMDGFYVIEPDSAALVVFDGDGKRLATVPRAGDGLLYHLDRLGNTNVVSNLHTGAFVGHDEYTPFGRLSVSIVITPHYSFQGGQFSDGLDIILLGARFYRPVLGRFLTPDAYLLIHQEDIPPIQAATNLYSYAYSNPTNYIDPTGQLVFLVILLVAVVVGAVLGAIGAATNGVTDPGEWFLWILGGAFAGALTALTGGALGLLFGAGAAGAAATGALIMTIIWASASLIGSILCPLLDDTSSPVAWFFSFLIKWIQSPILTTIGLLIALCAGIGGSKVELKHGALFIQMGSGNGALTLGAVVYAQKGLWQAPGNGISDNVARHEAHHTRTVVALGEMGFYFTYITVGALWAWGEGGPWNGLDASGNGNPFEKKAYRYFNQNTDTPSTS